MDSARDVTGRLVEHVKRQSGCLQLDSGRSLDPIIRDFSRPPTLYLSMMRGRRYYEDLGIIAMGIDYVLIFCFLQWHERVYTTVYVFSEGLC